MTHAMEKERTALMMRGPITDIQVRSMRTINFEQDGGYAIIGGVSKDARRSV